MASTNLFSLDSTMTVQILLPPLRIVLMAAASLSVVTCCAADHSYELGLEAAADYRYADARMHFQDAALRGDVQAQRNLGLMLLFGQRLYGGELSGNQAQAKSWLQNAAQNGDEVSTFMLNALGKH